MRRVSEKQLRMKLCSSCSGCEVAIQIKMLCIVFMENRLFLGIHFYCVSSCFYIYILQYSALFSFLKHGRHCDILMSGTD